MIPKDLTPEDLKIAWENLKAFMDVARRTGLSNKKKSEIKEENNQ